MRKSQLFKTNQSQQSIVPYKVTHDQSNSSPEEDRRNITIYITSDHIVRHTIILKIKVTSCSQATALTRIVVSALFSPKDPNVIEILVKNQLSF